MKKRTEQRSESVLVHHPKTADKELTAFRRVIGSIALRGPVPAMDFLDDDDEERTDDRARD